MANLIEQLKSEGYDVSAITPELVKQLQDEGYDTSALGSVQEEKGLWRQGMEATAENPAYKFSPQQMLVEGNEQAQNLLSSKVAPFVEEQIGTVAPPPVARAAGVFTKAALPAIETLGFPGAPELASRIALSSARGVGKGASGLRNLARILTGKGKEAAGVTREQMLKGAQEAVDAAEIGKMASNEVPPALAAAKIKLKEAPGRLSEFEQLAQKRALAQGKKIEKLESPLGKIPTDKMSYFFKEGNPDRVTNKLSVLSKQEETGAFAKMSPQEIRFNRLFVQEAARNPSFAVEASRARQINKALGQAMDNHIPGYSDQLKAYGKAQEVLDSMPSIKTKYTSNLKAKIEKMGQDFNARKLDAKKAHTLARINARAIKRDADLLVANGKMSSEARKKLLIALGVGAAGTGAIGWFVK